MLRRSSRRKGSIASPGKRHLFEIDVLRAATIAGVVMVHVVGLTGAYYGSGHAFDVIYNGAVTLLHFTRETFMFMTGLVLFYQYRDRDSSTWQFWGKRFPPTAVPYVAWSAFYILTSQVPIGVPVAVLWAHFWKGVLLGTASYQLYYMIITFQFYLLFPLLLWLFKRHPEWSTPTLILSAAVTVAWFVVLGRSGVFPQRSAWPWGARLQSHFFLPYVFYFVLGSWTALHLDQVLGYLKSHQRQVLWVGIGLACLLEGHYLYEVVVRKEFWGLAVAVLQPTMVPYCVGVILLLFLFAFALEREGPVRAFLGRITAKFADLSFGVYLCHVAFLTVFLRTIDPWLGWPAPWLMLLTWPVVIAVSAFVTWFLGRFRYTAILVGGKKPPKNVAARRNLTEEATT